MSERIDLAKLRKRVGDTMSGVASHGRFVDDYAYVLPCRDVLALVEAVEAARDLIDNAPFLVTEKQSNRYWSAVGKFDFGAGGA